MKVLAFVVLIVVSTTARGLTRPTRGSGPYLPSGWRPQGPAFLLPNEDESSSPIPLKDAPLQESVASGSDAFREYGPPMKEEATQDLTRQYLPDISADKQFATKASIIASTESLETTSEADEIKTTSFEAELTSATDEIISDAQGESGTESIDVAEIVEKEYTKKGKSLDLESQTVTVSIEEATEKVIQDFNDANVELGMLQKESTAQDTDLEEDKIVVVAEIKTLEEVNNLADVLLNLEKEKSKLQHGVQEEANAKIESTGSTMPDAPDGFLEYGPPGFKEYGPPKGNIKYLTTLEKKQPVEESISNEVRRRRFSPKIRITKRRVN